MKPNSTIDLGLLIWESITNVATGAIGVIDLIITIILCIKSNITKTKIACVSVLFYLIVVFDNIAIRYPLSPSWIVLVNMAAICFCIVLLLLQKQEVIYVDEGRGNVFAELSKIFNKTDNKKIIAIQLYKVETSQIFNNEIERVRFDVSHFGEDFVRKGHDINNISQISFELDRDIVDSFPLILEMYHKFRNDGDDNTKNVLIKTINEKIAILEAKLQEIDTLQRDVTKDDCSIARALTLFLSFRYILDPPEGARELQDDYIGEISLDDGDLKLNVKTENQLFSLYRTGILGAALLDNNLRHVFYYRKNGAKSGRKYVVSQLRCVTGQEKDNFSRQTLYICLFTIKENREMTYVPGYMFKSISAKEAEITTILNNM